LHRIATLLVAPLVLAALATACALPGAAQTTWTGASRASVTRESPDTLVTIRNETFRAVDPFIAGLDQTIRLVVKETVETVQAIDEKGARLARVMVSAWRFGDDPAAAPLWTITHPGNATEIVLGDFLAVHGENTDWRHPPKTLFALGDGRPLFVATVPWARFYVAGPGADSRYGAVAGANATELSRMAGPIAHAVAVLSYAGRTRVIDQLVLAAPDATRARTLLADEEEMALDWIDRDGRAIGPFEDHAVDGAGAPALRLRFVADGAEIRVPIMGDRLAPEHAGLPAGFLLVRAPPGR